MSATYICTDCHTKITKGLAVVRSVSFQQVAYCKPCAAERGIERVERTSLAVAQLAS